MSRERPPNNTMETTTQKPSAQRGPQALVGSGRLVRPSWSAEEDDSIRLTYAHANGGFPSYGKQADEINRLFHGGKPVRSAQAVRRREIALLTGKANTDSAKSGR